MGVPPLIHAGREIQEASVKVKDELLNILTTQNGKMLNENDTKFEWDERFYPMRLKALGPSLIPSEVIIPTENLLNLIEEIVGISGEISG